MQLHNILLYYNAMYKIWNENNHLTLVKRRAFRVRENSSSVGVLTSCRTNPDPDQYAGLSDESTVA